jgi:hypothetical protein
MFNFLNKCEDITTGIAAKTLIATSFFANTERWGLLRMKWTEARHVSADSTQRDILTDNVDDRHGRANSLDVLAHNPHADTLVPTYSRARRCEQINR